MKHLIPHSLHSCFCLVWFDMLVAIDCSWTCRKVWDPSIRRLGIIMSSGKHSGKDDDDGAKEFPHESFRADIQRITNKCNTATLNKIVWGIREGSSTEEQMGRNSNHPRLHPSTECVFDDLYMAQEQNMLMRQQPTTNSFYPFYQLSYRHCRSVWNIWKVFAEDLYVRQLIYMWRTQPRNTRGDEQ